MKTILSSALLMAALSMSAQRTPFPQAAPVGATPEAANVATHTDKVRSILYSAQNVISSYRDSVPPLVFQFTSAEQSALAAMEEDLPVMTRLLEKSLEQSLGENSPAYKMGIPMLVTSSGRSVRAMYLEGFGAMFMIKVSFPVLGLPAEKEKKPEQPTEDSEWERTRKELLGIDEPRGAAGLMSGAAVEFDPALVEALKKEILEALKNASNIRGLKSEEFVCVTVFGGPQALLAKQSSASALSPKKATTPARTVTRDEKAKPGVPGRAGYAVTYSSGPASQGTVLTVRVKKSDVDAFANGKLDFKAFEKRTTFNTYLGSGYDVTSVNSWSRPATSYGSGAGLRP
jgi:hypothetical protein